MYIGRARVGELLRGNKEAIQRCRVENFFSPLFFFFFFLASLKVKWIGTRWNYVRRDAQTEERKFRFTGHVLSFLFRFSAVKITFSYICVFFLYFTKLSNFYPRIFREKNIYISKLLYLTSLLNIIEYNIKVRVTALQISLCLQILKSNEFFLPDIYFFHSMLEQ